MCYFTGVLSLSSSFFALPALHPVKDQVGVPAELLYVWITIVSGFCFLLTLPFVIALSLVTDRLNYFASRSLVTVGRVNHAVCLARRLPHHTETLWILPLEYLVCQTACFAFMPPWRFHARDPRCSLSHPSQAHTGIQGLFAASLVLRPNHRTLTWLCFPPRSGKASWQTTSTIRLCNKIVNCTFRFCSFILGEGSLWMRIFQITMNSLEPNLQNWCVGIEAFMKDQVIKLDQSINKLSTYVSQVVKPSPRADLTQILYLYLPLLHDFRRQAITMESLCSVVCSSPSVMHYLNYVQPPTFPTQRSKVVCVC